MDRIKPRELEELIGMLAAIFSEYVGGLPEDDRQSARVLLTHFLHWMENDA